MGKDTKTGRLIDLGAELEKLRHKATRMEAVARLGESGSKEAIEPLLRLCRRIKGEDQVAVAQALAQLGKPAVKMLTERGLASKSASVRRCAARALGLMGQEAQPAYKALCKGLEEKSTSVRLQIIDALGKIGDPRAGETLAGLLDDDDDDVRERAIDALGKLGDGALTAVREVFLGADAVRVRVAAGLALGQIGSSQAGDLLRQAFEDRSFPSELRVAILSALTDLLGKDVVPIAEAALSEDDNAIRQRAVRCLRHQDTPASTARLVSLLGDGDKKVRVLAVNGLRGRYGALLERIVDGEIELLPALISAWRAMDRRHAEAANEIASSLVCIGNPLVPALIALLDLEQRGDDVIDVLAEIGPDAVDVCETLVAQLDNPDVATCCAAARALGKLGDPRVVPVLAQRLSLDPELLRAKKTREKRARKRALALQEAAATGLGYLGKAALSVALVAARNDDPVTRCGGMMALGHIGGGRALTTLERAIADTDEAVREAAAEALEEAAAQDVTRLSRLLKSDDERVRVKAIKALGKLDDLRSLDLLLRAYGDKSERVSGAVVEALVRREGDHACVVLIAAAAGGNVTAIRALQDPPTRQAAPALVEALDAPWRAVYSAALEAISIYVDAFGGDAETMSILRQAIPEVLSLLLDDSTKTRRMALHTLGAFGDATVVQDIVHLLQDRKASVRLAAVEALTSIGGEDATDALRSMLERTEDEDLHAELLDAIELLAGGVPSEVLPEPI